MIFLFELLQKGEKCYTEDKYVVLLQPLPRLWKKPLVRLRKSTTSLALCTSDI